MLSHMTSGFPDNITDKTLINARINDNINVAVIARRI